MNLFRYALNQRVRVSGRGETVYVIVRRRYDEGTCSAFVQYVLVAEADLDAQGRYVPYLSAYEPDVVGLEEEPPCT